MYAPGFGMPMGMPAGPGLFPAAPVPVPPPQQLFGKTREDAIEATRRKTGANQNYRNQMRERMRTILTEVDTCCNSFIASPREKFQFLDVCCCPGGFSAYTLDAQPAARGIGLSLPPDLGGHIPAIEQETSRYFMHLVDVTTVAANVRVGDLWQDNAPMRSRLWINADQHNPPSPFCDLVIMDGSFLGGKDWIHKDTTLADKDNPAFNVYRHNSDAHQALLVAQIIIALNNLRPGGDILLRLNMAPDLFTCGVLGYLRSIFSGDIMCCKPRTCHAHRDSYYLVCQGFDPQEALKLQWTSRWQALLQSLRSKCSKAQFAPFPECNVHHKLGLDVWHQPLFAYHWPLWRFRKLLLAAMDDKMLLDRMQPNRPRTGRYTHMCGRMFEGGGSCRNPHSCNAAHNKDELHPFVRKAFKEPLGFLHLPGQVPAQALAYMRVCPLLETKMEMMMQEEINMQAAALAAAASFAVPLMPMPPILPHMSAHGMLSAQHEQQAPLANLFAAHHNDYASAEMDGIAGEWVYDTYNDNEEGTRNELLEQFGGDDLMLMTQAPAGQPLEPQAGALSAAALPPLPLPSPPPPPPLEVPLPIVSGVFIPLPPAAAEHAVGVHPAGPGAVSAAGQGMLGAVNAPMFQPPLPTRELPPFPPQPQPGTAAEVHMADAAARDAAGGGSEDMELDGDQPSSGGPTAVAVEGGSHAQMASPTVATNAFAAKPWKRLGLQRPASTPTPPPPPLPPAPQPPHTVAPTTLSNAQLPSTPTAGITNQSPLLPLSQPPAAAAGSAAAGTAHEAMQAVARRSQPLPRIAGYHGRVSLVTVAVADKQSLQAVIDFLGC